LAWRARRFLQRQDLIASVWLGRWLGATCCFAVAVEQGFDLGRFTITDGAAVALGRNRKLLRGIEHVAVIETKVPGKLIDPDFAAARHA
jgi:hypothetical protein